jgi:hypothetical protein
LRIENKSWSHPSQENFEILRMQVD